MGSSVWSNKFNRWVLTILQVTIDFIFSKNSFFYKTFRILNESRQNFKMNLWYSLLMLYSARDALEIELCFYVYVELRKNTNLLHLLCSSTSALMPKLGFSLCNNFFPGVLSLLCANLLRLSPYWRTT